VRKQAGCHGNRQGTNRISIKDVVEISEGRMRRELE